MRRRRSKVPALHVSSTMAMACVLLDCEEGETEHNNISDLEMGRATPVEKA